jgi:hypothetical protein
MRLNRKGKTMVRKMFIFLFFLILAIFCLCTRQNVVSSSEDNFSSQDTAAENIINNIVDDRIDGDYYGDSITAIDTVINDTNNVDSSNVNFWINIKRASHGTFNRVQLQDWRIDSINAVSLSFVSLDSKDTTVFNFPIVNGVCATTKVKISSGHTYQVLVSLWHIQKCPWSTYSIYDRSFSAVDSIDLKSKTKDTLNVVFIESVKIKYFLGLKITGPWTEGKSYVAYATKTTTTPVRYEDGILWGYYVMDDLRSKYTQMMNFSSDTGKTLISFMPNVMSMITNGGVVMVAQDSVFFGVHESYEDSLGFIPVGDEPVRIRYSHMSDLCQTVTTKK